MQLNGVTEQDTKIAGEAHEAGKGVIIVINKWDEVEKDYKEATVIKLEQNYRSTTTILDAANDVIKHNKERKDKKLWSDNGKGEKITYYRAKNGIDEAVYVAEEINKLVWRKQHQNQRISIPL